MGFLSLLTRPAVLYSLVITLGGSLGTIMVKTYSQHLEISRLKDDLLTITTQLSRCQNSLAIVQADLSRQASEIDKYNRLASRYTKQLESKYTTKEVVHQPCSFDFTMMNDLLTRQGMRP